MKTSEELINIAAKSACRTLHTMPLFRHPANVNGLNPDYVPLHIAARCGHTNVIEMLARRGANLEVAVSRDVPDGYGGQAMPKGSRALHAAVMSGEPGAVQALLEAGARLEIQKL